MTTDTNHSSSIVVNHRSLPCSDDHGNVVNSIARELLKISEPPTQILIL